MDDMLRQQLLAMAAEDARVRAELAGTGELFRGYAPRMEEVHRRNGRELLAIATRQGWPGRDLVGEDAMHAAWLVLQHAIGEPAVLRACLPILREAAARGQATQAQVAHLEDRIAFFERRPQRYGTQFDWDERGMLSPWPIEDPEGVDARRSAVGLPPLADRIAQARKSAQGSVPPDYARRQAEMLAWSRLVGWIG
jgi:uncharacterized protein DUF6624